MHELHNLISSSGNMFIVGNKGTGKTEFIKNIISIHINKSKDLNIVLDTTGEYKEFTFSKNKAIGYYSFKSINEINMINFTRYKVVICDLSAISKNDISNATEIIINKLTTIKNRLIRITIDTTSDYNLCLNLNGTLKNYLKISDNLKFTIIAINSCDLNNLLKDFNTYIVFSISPFTKRSLNEYIPIDLLNIGIMLEPFNLIVYNRELETTIIKNIRNESIGLKKLS